MSSGRLPPDKSRPHPSLPPKPALLCPSHSPSAIVWGSWCRPWPVTTHSQPPETPVGSPFTCLQTPNPPTWAPPTSPLMWIILPAQQALASPLLPAVQILRAAAGVLLKYAPWWAVSIHSPLIMTCHLSVKARAHTMSLRAAPSGSLSPLTAPALAELTSCLSTNLGICTFCPLLQRLFLSPESACSPLQQVLA